MANTDDLNRTRVRIPLVGVHNTRNLDSTTSSFNASGVVGLGVVGLMVVGRVASSDKDQRFVNCIIDKIINPVTNSESYFVLKRPGFASHIVPASGSVGNAVRVWASQGTGTKIISSFGTTNSTIYDGTTSLGTITGRTLFLDEALIGSTPTILITSNNQTGWYYQDGGVPTKISDADFPTNITGHFVSMDGYTFIMTTDGKIYNSDLNSITSWSSLGFISAQMYPDFGIGLARYKDQLVAFGKETIEFFHIEPNATGSPLGRTISTFIRIGCASQQGYVQMEDTLAWISATDRGGCSIYMLEGYVPKRISSSTIDSQLSFAGPDSVKLRCCKILGKTLIFVIANNLTFVYSVEEGVWTEWQSQTPLWDDITVATASGWQVYTISSNLTGGKIYTINPTNFVYTDDGLEYTMTLQTSKVDTNTNKRKFLSKVEIIGDTQSSGTLHVSWSDDDYQTFANARSLDISAPRMTLHQCGQFRRRAFKITHSDPTPCRLEAMELELTLGRS